MTTNCERCGSFYKQIEDPILNYLENPSLCHKCFALNPEHEWPIPFRRADFEVFGFLQWWFAKVFASRHGVTLLLSGLLIAFVAAIAFSGLVGLTQFLEALTRHNQLTYQPVIAGLIVIFSCALGIAGIAQGLIDLNRFMIRDLLAVPKYRVDLTEATRANFRPLYQTFVPLLVTGSAYVLCVMIGKTAPFAYRDLVVCLLVSGVSAGFQWLILGSMLPQLAVQPNASSEDFKADLRFLVKNHWPLLIVATVFSQIALVVSLFLCCLPVIFVFPMIVSFHCSLFLSCLSHNADTEMIYLADHQYKLGYIERLKFANAETELQRPSDSESVIEE